MAVTLNPGLPSGSRGLWWFDEGLGNLGTAATGSAALSGTASLEAGGYVLHTVSGAITELAANAALLLPTTAITVMLGLRCTDTSPRPTGGFGVPGATSAEACGTHLPYSDNTVYWDFGGQTSGSTRVTYAWTKDTTLHVWGFTVGSRGMEIWRDGTKVASNAATPTRTSTSSKAYQLGRHMTAQSDQVEYHWAFIHETQLSEALIAAISADPAGELTSSPIPQAVADTVTLTESLGRVQTTPTLKSVADTVAFTEALRRMTEKRHAETLLPTEALTTAATGMLAFTDALLVVPALDGALYRFRDTVHVIQAPFLDFTDVLDTVRSLQDFLDVVRTVPPLRALFDDDIHRPVGRVEETG